MSERLLALFHATGALLETYSVDAVLDELMRDFTNVRIVKFLRYMGFESRSKRVLIRKNLMMWLAISLGRAASLAAKSRPALNSK